VVVVNNHGNRFLATFKTDVHAIFITGPYTFGDNSICLNHRSIYSIVVTFELFELYYWLELYELYYKRNKVHKVHIKFMKFIIVESLKVIFVETRAKFPTKIFCFL